MKQKNSTRKSLVLSVLSLLCCFAMLLGTTYAWFTDTVTSAGNTIQAGNLKIDLLHKVDNQWISLKETTDHKVFDYDRWEPGYTRVELLDIQNLGTLALQYKLSLGIESGTEDVGKNGERLADVIKVYVSYGDNTGAESFADIEKGTAWQYAGTLSDVIKNPTKFVGGQLLPKGASMDAVAESAKATTAIESQYVTVALHMDENAGNEYQGIGVGNLTVNLLATQWSYEDDSFDAGYDQDAIFPLLPGQLFYASAPAKFENGIITLGNENDMCTAVVSDNVTLADGATEVALNVSVVEIREADVDNLNGGDVLVPLDVHVDGVSENNTTPVLITVRDVLPKNYASYNIRLFHVEDGTTVQMTAVASLEELDAHNEFYYDPATGEITLAMATFSEVTAAVTANNPWDGTAVDTSWYNTTSTEFTLDTAAQFAGFAQIVGGMNGQTQDSFKGKTVKLDADINLGGRIWYPIGYYNSNGNYDKVSGGSVESDVLSFEGTFDGQGHTISNVYQNTWEMFGDYNSGYSGTPNHYKDGMGIFGWVQNGTVQNLAVSNFQSDGEFCTTGCVAAYSSGVSTFENIRITNCNPRAYNVPNGGVVGYAYDEETAETNSITFSNISVDPTTKITALWGSWDVGCGGILGRSGDNTTVTMTNCSVGAIMDVYNDVCANYQYYDFRYSGMLIGTVGSDGDPSDQSVSFNNVQVYYGDWSNDYHYYCELVENSIASYTHDYQFSRLTKINSVIEIQDLNGDWNQTGNFVVVDGDTTTCYHIRKDADGKFYEHKHEDSGIETIDGVEVLVEDKQRVHIPFRQLYTGYGWGATSTAEGANVSEAKYTITFMTSDGNRVLDVQYITNNDAISIDTYDDVARNFLGDEYAGNAFGGWITAGSVKIADIAAGNTKNYVLYPTHKEKFVARWLDENGDTYYTETFDKGQSALKGQPADPTSAYDYLEFDHWEVKVGDQYVELSEYNLSQATGDIAIYPYFNVKQGEGTIGLTPGPDEDGDGRPDSYSVEAVSGLSGDIVIPGNVNGAPVKVITDLSSDWLNGNITSIEIKEGVETIEANAFAMTLGLKEVTVPSSVESVGANTFASNAGTFVGKKVDIEYAGTWEQWKSICKDNWDSGLANGSKVVCSDLTYVLNETTTEGFLYQRPIANHDWNDWQKQQ